jgi:hypothetical protein
MNLEDEEEFLAFLRASADIAIYRSWAPAAAPVESFADEISASPFWVHNLAFTWNPVFERVTYQDKADGKLGEYFRLATRYAPLLEYSRHPLNAISPKVSGRLYWSKSVVSQSHEFAYDVTAFDAWFSSVARWIRSRSKKVQHGTTEVWCLPAAQRRLQATV